MTDLDIRPSRFGAPAAQLLIAAAQADIAQRYGLGDESPIEAVQFNPPEGCFLVAWRDDEPVACGGWRILAHYGVDGQPKAEEDVAELKRMYAAPAVRGTGVAAALLAALEDSARSRGMRRMVLETGGRHGEAIRFYTKQGYRPIPNFGFYRDDPDCYSFGRDL